jgi:hypothetical protein
MFATVTVRLVCAASRWAEMGFDSRHFNAFDPVTQDRPENPPNPANRYHFDVPLAPLEGGRRLGDR